MKKLTILLSALLCLTLSACTGAGVETPQDTSQNGDSFYAKILSIDGDTVLAEPLEGEWVLDSCDQFSFSKAALPDIGAIAGSYVNIVFTGDIAESYPAQITVVNWSDISDQFRYPEYAPEMTLYYGEFSTVITPFPPVEWSTYVEGGVIAHSFACGFGALDDGAVPLLLTRAENTPVLLLSEALLPDQITAVAWSADVLSLPAEERLNQYENALPLETSGGYIYLPEDGGSYLVLATAVWNDKADGRTPFGSSDYLFLLQ